MQIFHSVKLPFDSAVGIFTILFLVILFLPPIFKKFRIPGIIGLIFAGILVGPHGLNLLSKEIGFNILGSFGLLYLMFLVGLEINMQDFLQNRVKALIFGILSFFLPFLLGIGASVFLFDLDNKTSVAIATLLGTHTLVAYPIVSKYGIKKNIAVTLVIGATIIADTLALIFAGVIAELSLGGTSVEMLLSIVIRYFILFFFTIFIVPALCRWFFKNFEGETTYEFIFTLTMAMISAFLAELIHIEPIIGTFFAGLAMNKYIPHTSQLMGKISFFGESLFIPLFLIGVGILINPIAFLSSFSVWKLVLVLIIVYIIGKYLAAFVIQKIMHLKVQQRNLIAGLSSAKAAAAIAIAIIIYKSGLMDETIINITVLLILFTSIYSSFLTDYSSRKIIFETSLLEKKHHIESDRILLSVSNPLTMCNLFKFAVTTKNDIQNDPLFLLSIAKSTDEAGEILNKNKEILNIELEKAKQQKVNVKFITLVDLNISDGISIAAKDLLIDRIVIGWNLQTSSFKYFFGDLLHHLLNKTDKMIFAVKLSDEITTCSRTVIVVPPNFEYEKSCSKTLESLINLSNKVSNHLVIICQEISMTILRLEIDELKPEIKYSMYNYDDIPGLKELNFQFENTDLLIPISARKHSISYNRNMDEYPYEIAEKFNSNNCIIVFPEHERQSYVTALHM